MEECFGVGVSAEAIRQYLHSMGYSSWKRTRYVPSGEPDPEEKEEKEARERGAGGAQKGAEEGRIVL